ncbi:hypothetical protein GBAR_LOCUS19703 [Geodia barretti]|uniref:Uncharacterized protein n=1 Tax=Geodia barretti TaxID=519541 RepID=A0AA35STK1_GEOBA|nr:hypothetical protein GBAR_LOCUS19703 [Geodia barretti]
MSIQVKRLIAPWHALRRCVEKPVLSQR